MKTHTWPEDEREEFEALCREARDAGGSISQQVDAFIDLIQTAEGSGSMWVRDVIREIWRVGAASIFKKWIRRQNRPIAMSYDGKVLSKARTAGRKRQSRSGAVVHEQTLFDFFSWEELREKVAEYARQITAYKSNLYLVTRLLELEDAAPGAASPAEALDQIGMSMQEWIDAEEAA